MTFRRKLIACTTLGVLAVVLLIIKWWPGPYSDFMASQSFDMQFLYQTWVDAGRPSHYDPNKAIETPLGSHFNFTNIIFLNGKTYHCRFAFRPKPEFAPPGLLVITDEKVVLWIRDRDGKIFLSPERGIKP